MLELDSEDYVERLMAVVVVVVENAIRQAWQTRFSLSRRIGIEIRFISVQTILPSDSVKRAGRNSFASTHGLSANRIGWQRLRKDPRRRRCLHYSQSVLLALSDGCHVRKMA